ncbi:hypothetical protein [Evansella tamaricis]|nr:hypothetical protein [Evansella tamaricis]
MRATSAAIAIQIKATEKVVLNFFSCFLIATGHFGSDNRSQEADF